MEIDLTDTAGSPVSSALETSPVLNLNQGSTQDYSISPNVVDEVLSATTLKIAENNRCNSFSEDEKSQSYRENSKETIETNGKLT